MDASTVKKLKKDPDFVIAPRFGNSLERLMERFLDGVPEDVCATALNLLPEEVEQLYEKTVKDLQVLMLGGTCD
jgi:hypothetical protein